MFQFNVMPANAAAWYMAKRKFYMNQSFDQQLLPFLLKKYPEKFRVIGNSVIFLEVYKKDVAKAKLKYLVQYGLNAYFCIIVFIRQYLDSQFRNALLRALWSLFVIGNVSSGPLLASN